MKRLASRLVRAFADWLHPPPAQSNADHAAAIKREFEESQRKPLTPEQRIANRVAMLPNAVQRDAYLLELERIRVEQEVEAEYGCAASREIARDIERAAKVMPIDRKRILRGAR